MHESMEIKQFDVVSKCINDFLNEKFGVCSVADFEENLDNYIKEHTGEENE